MDSMNAQLPAITGGKPAVTLDQQRANCWPILTREDEEAVLSVMRDGDLSTHAVIRDLELDYTNFTGRKYALTHCNGTAALLAAFYALDLKPGDEVIVPSATFWASVLPMLWLGAIPVFCESEPDRLGPDPVDIEQKITERTRAIVVVHLWGLPAKMTEINRIAREHNLKIIEDASHAHGAYWNDRPCGTLGDISVFSLQGDKLAPGGEGGVLLCDDYSYYEKATCLGDITRIIELETAARRFAATSFGIKTRIAPLSAAIARVQLKHLAKRNARRNKNLSTLSRRLEPLGFHTYLPPDHIQRTYFEFIIRYDEAETGLPIDLLIKALRAEGCHIDVPRYPLLHQQPFFTEGHYQHIARLGGNDALPDYSRISLPNTERANQSFIRLPSFPNAEQELLDQYAQAFEKVLQHKAAISEHFRQADTRAQATP
jgi:perosamine synthetase